MRKYFLTIALILSYSVSGTGAAYGQATKLIITGSATQNAGASQDITIQADSSGVPAASYTGAKILTFSGANSSTNPATAPTVSDSAGNDIAFGSPTVLKFVNGLATVSAGKNGALTLYNVESALISVTDGSIHSSGGNRLAVTVSAGSLEKFIFALASPQINNVVFTGTNSLTAQDSWGNTITTYNASTNPVTISVNSLSGTIIGLDVPANVLNQAGDFISGVADLDALGIRYVGLQGTGSFTATSTSPSKTGSSSSVTINPGTARKFVMTGSSSQVAGQSQNPVITAKDTSGNTATSYTGSKNLTYSGAASSGAPVTAPTASSSGGSAIAFGSTVSLSFSSGVATSSGSNNGTLKLYKVESATVSVTDGTISTSDTDRLTVNVTPGTVAKFAVVLTSPQTNGAAFSGTNTVTAQDSWGNTVTGFDGSVTPVTLTPSLSGTVTGLGSGNNAVLDQLADFSSGIANLTSHGMTYTGATGSGTFTASSTTPSATGISNSITISAGTATRLVITGQATQTAGILQNLTITAKDGSNNTVTSYTGSKSLVFSGANASTDPVTTPKVRNATGTDVAFGSATSITFTNGVATVSGGNNGVLKLYKAETAVISVTDGSIGSSGSDRLSVIVSADAIGKFSFALAGSQQNNVPFASTNTLTAEDDWGNILTTYNASSNPVIITVAGVTGTVLGLGTGGNNTLNQAGDFGSGVANLTLLGMKYLGTSGNATFTATSTSPAKTGISSSVTITPGTPKRFALSGSANAGAGVANSLTITAQDTSGNTATGYTGLKSLSFSGANVSPDGNAPTVTSNTGSERNFSGVPNTDLNFTAGVASVSGNTNGVMRLRKVESASIAVTDGSISTPTGGSLAVTTTPAGLGRFAVVMTPTQINGVPFTGVNTITAIDSFGNTATSFSSASNNVTVTAPSLSGTITGLGSGSTNVLNQAGDFVLGIANVSNKIEYTGVTGASTFRAVSVSGKEGVSASVTINVGSATRLVLSGSPTQNAGDPQSLTITAKDSSGNTVTSYAGAKSLVFSGSGASPNPATSPTVTASNGTQVPFGLSTTITFSSGVATVSGANNGVMRLFRAGKDTVAVSDGSISAGAGDRLIVAVNPGVLAKFLFSLNSPQQNGVAFAGANTLTAQDTYGNTVTGFDPSAGESVTITPLSPLSGTVSGLGSAGNNTLNQTSDFVQGVANLTGKMKYTGIVQTGLFTAASVSNKVGSSGSVQIVAGGATRLVIRTSANDSVTTAIAGGTRDLRITAKDASNNTVTTYTGSKSLTFSGADSSLSPASPATVTNSSASAIPLGAVTSINFTNGVANISGASNGVLRLLRAQTALISATDGTISSSGNDQLSVTVSPSVLGKFTLTLQSPQTNGIAFTGTNTLTARDDWGNTVTTFIASTTPVTLSTTLAGAITGLGTGGLATLNKSNDFNAGVADLSSLGMKYTGAVGSGTFTANGGGKTGQSSSVSVVAGGATRLVMRTSAGDSVTTMTAGTSRNLVITAKDGSGNTVTAYTGAKSMQFSGADSSHLPAIPPTVTNSGGTATAFGANTSITFTNGIAQVTGSSNGVLRLYQAQNATIVVTDGTIASSGNDRLLVTVAPGALGKFLWDLGPSQTSGVAFTGVNTLTAQDDWGNAVTSFDASTSNVSLSTSLGGTISGLGTGNNEVLNRSIDFNSGEANITALGMKYTGPIGTGVFTATAAGKAGTSDSVTIAAGLATHLVLTGTATQIAGTAQNLTITARDASNNIVPGYAGTRTLTFSGASPTTNPVTAPTVSNNAGTAIPFTSSTLVTFTNGTATVSGSSNGVMRLYKAENAIITVTDGTISATGSDRLTVAVSPGALGQFSWNLVSPQTNGVSFIGTNTLVAQDDWGNTVPTFNASTNNVTVTASLPGSVPGVTGLGSLGNNVLNQATNFSLGIANLTALGMKYSGTAGTGTFTATSAVGSKNGTSSTVTINNPVPTLTAITPGDASRLQSVTIGLTGTNFIAGVTTVSFGPNISIDSTIYESATHITVRVTVGATAVLGLRGVSVTNPVPGGGTSTLASSFRVKNVPSIVSLTPANGIRGTTLDVLIVGTNFADGVVTVGILGSNITLNAQTIVSASTIRANITISLAAIDGVRYFTVTNSGPEGGTSNQVAFTVGNNPAPTLVSVKPDTISRLQTVELTLRGTEFYNGITSLNLGAGITVIGSVVFDSTTQLRVNVTVTDTAGAGLRNVSVTNAPPAGGTATLTNRLLIINPVPTFTGLSVQNGSRLQTLPLTLSGTKFIRGLTQAVFGSGITVNSSNVDGPTQMSVDITIDSSAALGVRNLSITNPAPGGGTAQLPNAFTVNNPTPTITAVAPESTLVGSGTLTLVVTGTNFVPGSSVRLGTFVLASVLVNQTRLNATVPPSELDTARTFAVTVVNSIPAGGTSNSQNFKVQNPAPTLATLTPANGSRLQTMDVVFNGTNFIPGITQVNFGATDITVNGVSYQSPLKLTTNITISSSATIGPRDVTVSNPSPGGGTSEKRTFTVADNPVPTILTVNPSFGARLGKVSVVVTGTNFIPGVTSLNLGSGITVSPPVINSSSQLTSTITIGVNAATGPRSVSVTNASPGGGTATKVGGFTVNNPEPTLTSIDPTNMQQLQTKNITFNGSGFIDGVSNLSMGDGITVNSKTVVSDSQMTASITVTLAASTGARDVSVTNNPPGGGTAILTNGFVVGNNPMPVLTSVTPATGRKLETLNLVFLGQHFISGVTKIDLGSDITTNSLVVDSSSGLTANVTILAVGPTGARTVYLKNDPPGGGTDSIVNGFTVTYPVPVLTSVTPPAVTRNQTANVTLRGSNFLNGITTANFGAGIVVNSLTADSTTRAIANITISPSATLGARNLVVNNPSPGGGNSGPIAFTVSLAAPPSPTLTTPWNGQPNLPQVLMLKWDSSAGATQYHLQVSASSLFQNLVVDDSSIATPSKKIGPLLNNTTYYWRVRGKNAGGMSAFSSTWSFTPSYPGVLSLSTNAWTFPTLSSPKAYVSANYRIVGVPGAGTYTPGDYFGATTQGTVWQLYADNGDTVNYFVVYKPNDPSFKFSTGRAYWLVRTNDWNFPSTMNQVASAPLDTAGMALIPIHHGWNLITNPFALDILWSAVQQVNNSLRETIWEYTTGTSDPKFQQAAAMKPYVGYYFYNVDTITQLKAPYAGTSGVLKTADSTAGWMLTLGVTTPEFADRSTEIGVRPDAEDGLDRYDHRRPRMFGSAPALVVMRPDLDPRTPAFATEFRKSVGTIVRWNLDMYASRGKEVTLDVTGAGAVPAEYEVFLVDHIHAKSVDLRTAGVYRFVPVTDRSQFSVLVGTHAAVQAELGNIIPRAFALEQNYPNPFNPTTTIGVAVPLTGAVTVKIYNILGEEIVTLHDGVLEQGRHWLAWDGRNGAGRMVATGVYLTRMTTPAGGSHVIKMMLMK